MMELNPVVRFHVFVPFSYAMSPADLDSNEIELGRREIIFALRSCYRDHFRCVCLSAVEASGCAESKCSSPAFAPLTSIGSTRKYIPEETEEWMRNFADMMILGAQWGRRNFK